MPRDNRAATLALVPSCEATPPTLGRRVWTMALLWLALAVPVGIGTAPSKGGMIALVAGLIAGVIVLVPFGVVLALLGGKWDETLVGATAGFLVGAAAGLFAGHADVPRVAATSLLAGSLVGATFPEMLRRARATFLALASLWPRRGVSAATR